MKLTPISRSTLGDQVASQLAGMISSGRWKPGEKLPSEMELRKSLGIGRSTLREALRSLSYVGLVVIRPGDGTYVEHRPAQPEREILIHGKLSGREDINDVFETRAILESEQVSLCAQRASAVDIQKIEALALEMEANLDQPGDRFASIDIQFHLAIADGAKNRILSRLFHAIHGMVEQTLAGRENERSGRELACAGHRKILSALKQRNPEAARIAMREHLDRASASYLRNVMADAPSGSVFGVENRKATSEVTLPASDAGKTLPI